MNCMSHSSNKVKTAVVSKGGKKSESDRVGMGYNNLHYIWIRMGQSRFDQEHFLAKSIKKFTLI